MNMHAGTWGFLILGRRGFDWLDRRQSEKITDGGAFVRGICLFWGVLVFESWKGKLYECVFVFLLTCI